MRVYNRMKSRGFTLVELMIVVAIIGVLAALAIYGVRQYLLSAKTAEAKEGVGRLAKDAAGAYDREGMAGAVLTIKNETAAMHRLCLDAATTVPAAKGAIQGKKYQSSPAEWNAGSGTTGWQCLKFSMKDPQYFMYGYEGPTDLDTAGEVNTLFAAVAQGDLNADGTTSDFRLQGKIQAGSSGGLVATVSPNFLETNPQE